MMAIPPRLRLGRGGGVIRWRGLVGRRLAGCRGLMDGPPAPIITRGGATRLRKTRHSTAVGQLYSIHTHSVRALTESTVFPQRPCAMSNTQSKLLCPFQLGNKFHHTVMHVTDLRSNAQRVSIQHN